MGIDPAFVGPHEGRELELMLASIKTMSMFVDFIASEVDCFPEAEFDTLVSEGKLIKHVSYEKSDQAREDDIQRTLYTVPGEEWRINAVLPVEHLYSTLAPGWRPDLDRVIGLLLGYEREDIENFLVWKAERHGNKS